MRYLFTIIAIALFYYLIGAFIYGTFDSVLWDHEGKVGLSFCYGFTTLIIVAFTIISEHEKS
jgi:hypothetical protein